MGASVQGRDELAIKKTVTGLLKIIHPFGEPSEEEFNDIVSYAVEGRRRVKEQMNKRKPDDEFASINLSFFKEDGFEQIVYCPESKDSKASQNPRKEENVEIPEKTVELPVTPKVDEAAVLQTEMVEKHIKVHYGDLGYSYEKVFGPYLKGAAEITIEDPYLRKQHQITNLVKFCELAIKIGDVKKIKLVTSADDEYQWKENKIFFDRIANSLYDNDVEMEFEYSPTLHDRQVLLSNGWRITMGRGLDYFQSLDGNYFQLGANDQELRCCLETHFTFSKL